MGSGSALVARAERAVWLSGTDPELAESESRAVLAEAEAVPPETRCARHAEAIPVALRAAALAARELGDIDLAVERLERAVAVGADFPNRVAQARMSLVTVVAELGDPERGLRLADLAERDLTGTDLARLGVQRSAAFILLGRFSKAVRHCDHALGMLDGDPRFRAGGLLNRGVARTYLEEYDQAETDLSACARIARTAGLDHLAMLAEGNLPFVAARRGDIPGAFESYRAAEGTLFGYPERLAVMRTDFAQALVAARLLGEARTLLEQVVPDLAASGAQAGLADARLLLAQVELLTGVTASARASAEAARSDLVRQGRAARVPLATDVVLRARLAQERPSRELLDELLACAHDLQSGGFRSDAAALRLTAAETALRMGEPRTARDQLEILIGSPARTMVRQHALATLLRLDGDVRGALSAAWSGLAAALAPRPPVAGSPEPPVIDQETGGSSDPSAVEARAYAARAAEDLAQLCVRLALETGDPWTVLTCSERWRALVRGAPGRAGAQDEGLPAEMERTPAGSLIELVRSGDELAAVLVTAGRRVLRSLGSYRATAEATVRVRYALRRRNLRDVQVESGMESSMESGMERDLALLDELLLAPLDVPGGPVTIVPAGALHTLPWPLLPSLRGRPVSVAGNASSWLGGIGAPSPPDEPVVVAVAGPGLEHAGAEADAVVRSHPGAVRVTATRDAVLAALGHADVLHIAAHGTFSPRGPLLSRISLDDGPLMAYDLIRPARAPRLVILSACDAGMAHAPVDGAVLGLAGTFLDRGARCVIAGVVPVRDDEALALMTALHPLLGDGRPPAEALAAAARATGVPGFVCFGEGDQPVATGRSGSATQWDQEPT
ncbi:CHAT domain-containing protein [Microtetraspora sp. NBRC 16547]|uniref:CHAT domain-containing protein n=1 Tax=Microtetraspora sp. NBRC 16547 TaxID=3030993 RepID=UPI0024A4053D|nr:CHAT domain-containing protein [Microtetraspora sp. NBRC 16547]GLX00812.1 CHAT domain-containing protein [Microtetraspora sp. NBRC 16547]